MLDKRTEDMLEAANRLIEEDLDYLRSTGCATLDSSEEPVGAEGPEEDAADVIGKSDDAAAHVVSRELDDGQEGISAESPNSSAVQASPVSAETDPARGERERKRTRESKIATECVGQQRPKHEWWPVGTQLQGKIMGKVFTALVVENQQVKSNRSLLITSGPANGKVCITPTRAALEATEAYRQANNLGRGGGVTNGWEFWQPVVS